MGAGMTAPRGTPAAARGLGAAGHGTGHWLAQRASALALVPLTLWFVAALANDAATDLASLSAWLTSPINAILMILLLIAAFHHAALGLRVMAEDYVHSRARFAIIALIQLVCFGGAVAGIVATLLIAIDS